MRQFISILALSIFILSCGQNENKQKESELKEKEIAPKVKDTTNLKPVISVPDTVMKKSTAIEKNPEIPPDGNYIYSTVDLEMNSRVTGKCNVNIKGYTFTSTASDGYISRGILKKKSGHWVIVEGEDETGVDFKKKEIYEY